MSIISIGIPIPDRSALPGQTGSGEEVNLQYTTQNYCEGTGTYSPTVATPVGGTFTSSNPSSLAVNQNSGLFNLGVATPGNYTITYTVTGVGSANFPINITALDNAAFSYSASAFCADASNQTPTITTPGGTFTTQDITFRPFQMKFEVDSGTQKTISIPVRTGTSYTIDWGDGSPVLNNYSAGTQSHTYNDGTYNDVTDPTVSIGDVNDTGPMTACYFYTSGSYLDLIDIPQWGNIVWSSWYRFFWGCTNLTNISATDTPDLSNGPDMQYCFILSGLTTPNLDNWDISNVTSLTQMFNTCSSLNTSIDNWEFIGSNNINLTRFMVSAASFNGDVSTWNVSGVSSFDSTFRLTVLNQNLSNWYNDGFSANLTTMNQIFRSSQMSDNAFTDTIVGWAVAVRRDSGPYNVSGPSSTPATFQTTRTQDTDNSGNTVDYSTKYGTDWDSNWSDAGDARQFLLDNGWTIA